MALIVLLFWIPLRELPGLGTILNVVLVGVSADAAARIISPPDTIGPQVACYLAGLLLLTVSDATYLGARFGSGPRDGLMTGATRVTGRPMWLVRTGIEAIVLTIGWVLRGTVGVGTFVIAAAMGPAVQLFLRFTTVHLPGDHVGPDGRAIADVPADLGELAAHSTTRPHAQQPGCRRPVPARTFSAMSRVHPRRAEQRDVGALVELRALMFEAMGICDDDTSWRTRARQWFGARIEDPALGIFVLEHAGRVVACAMGAIRDAAPSPTVPSGQDILISNVCVVPELRGQGHGRAVFDEVMQWAHGTGVGRAELMATHDGRGMYEQAGFSPTHSLAMRATFT